MKQVADTALEMRAMLSEFKVTKLMCKCIVLCLSQFHLTQQPTLTFLLLLNQLNPLLSPG